MLLIHASAVIKISLAIEHSFYKVNIKFIPAPAGIQTSEYSDKNAIMADSIRYCLFENQLKGERIRELYESADDLSGNRESIPSTHLGRVTCDRAAGQRQTLCPHSTGAGSPLRRNQKKIPSFSRFP
jgi:hypothetical protein